MFSQRSYPYGIHTHLILSSPHGSRTRNLRRDRATCYQQHLQTISSGSRIRTDDLRDMSPPSWPLLYPAIICAGTRDRTESIPAWKAGAPPLMRYLHGGSITTTIFVFNVEKTYHHTNSISIFVGTIGFEPMAACSSDKCSTPELYSNLCLL